MIKYFAYCVEVQLMHLESYCCDVHIVQHSLQSDHLSTRYNLELLISDELNLPNGWDFIDIGWMIGTLLIWEGCPMRKGLYMVMWPRCFLPRARGLNLWRMESPRADTSAVYWTTTIRGFSPHSVKINVYKTNPRVQKGASDHSGVCSYYL